MDSLPPPVPPVPPRWPDPRSVVDAEHLAMLAVFHYVVGALAILISSVFLFHVAMGLTLAAKPEFMQGVFTETSAPMFVTPTPSATPGSDEVSPDATPSVATPSPTLSPQGIHGSPRDLTRFQKDFPSYIGLIFAGLGAVMVLVGWTIGGILIYSGRCIRHRRAKTFSLIVAGVCCLFFPFGTVLGVFTFVVLLRPSVDDLYRASAVSGPPALPRSS